jgi:hypothetical protein
LSLDFARRLRDTFASHYGCKAKQIKPQTVMPNVYKRKPRSGQVSYVVDIGLIKGRRERQSFKTKAEAEVFAELKEPSARTKVSQISLCPMKSKWMQPKPAYYWPRTASVSKKLPKYYLKHVVAYQNAPMVCSNPLCAGGTKGKTSVCAAPHVALSVPPKSLEVFAGQIFSACSPC